MRTVVLREFGGPEKLLIEDVDNPEPGPGQVRVRIRAIGLNRAEVAARAGKYPLPQALPVRLGFEASGRVDKVGREVSEFKTGDRVSVIPVGDAFAEQGTYAEYCLVPAEGLTHTPQPLSDEEAAATWMAYLTCWAALLKQAQAQAGDIAIVTAASSSLGAPAFQVLKSEGMLSIACTRSAEKIERIFQAGAEHVIDTSSEDLAARVKEITSGKGANLAFDPIGGPGIREIIRALAPGGKIILYGMLDSRPMEITPWALMAKQLTIYSHIIFRVDCQ
ncbi:MAG: zinc-dependent alcohol dehydrogenase family protein, partial [Candidatus Zixiibacteriota bacterium]